jgi:hypothetical protein
MRRLLLALTLAVTPLVLVASPAHAAGGTLSVPAGVLFPCEQHPYSYSLDVPPGASSALLKLDITGPDGLSEGSEVEIPKNATGSGSFQLCADAAGPYTMSGTVTYYSGYSSTDYPITPTTFAMRQPLTQTAVTASPKKPKKNQTVKFKVLSTVERPAGYFANAYATVHVEEFYSGKWHVIRKSKAITDDTGRATIKVGSGTSKFKARAVTEASSDNPGSVSPALKVR